MKISIDQSGYKAELKVSLTYTELKRIRRAENAAGQEQMKEEFNRKQKEHPENKQITIYTDASYKTRDLIKKLEEVENSFINFCEAKRSFEDEMAEQTKENH